MAAAGARFDQAWLSVWSRMGFIVALLTAFAAIAAGDEAVRTFARLGAPFALLVAALVVAVVARNHFADLPTVAVRTLNIAMVFALCLATVSYASAFARDQEAAEFMAATQDRAPLDWSGRTIVGRDMADTELRNTVGHDAVVRGVSLAGSDLSGSDFRKATFEDVDVTGATLCAIDVRGADLRGLLNLTDARTLNFLVYDENTMFPDGTDPAGLAGAFTTQRDRLLYSCAAGETRTLVLGAIQP